MDSDTSRDRRYVWIVLALLCLVYVLNFLDRQLLSILAKPIQDELGISDGQLGRLSGLYFALFYCILGIPVAWLADRSNRVRILTVACALWSAATVACGMAQSYAQLAVARMSVGVGEAGGVPPSYSIISDYFPASRRGTALGLFNLGPPIGQAVGVAFGAKIAAVYDWRLAFFLLGGAGLVAAAVVWGIVREPKRGATDAKAQTPAAAEITEEAVSFWATLRMFATQPTLALVSLAAGATQFVTYATMGFTTLFLMREKAMTLDEIAIWYALVLGIGVSAGIFLSGRMIDRFGHRSPQVYGLLPGIALAVAVPFFIGFVHAPTWPVALAFLTVPTFLNYFYLTPAVTLVQNAVSARQRTLAGAVLLLVMNLIGLGLGPTWVGAVSDWFRPTHPANSLQLAFYSLVPFYLVAIVLHLMLARRLARSRSDSTMTTASIPGAMQSYALTLDRFIDHAAKWHGAAEVVTGGSGGVSARIGYSALRDRSRRLSGAFHSLGLMQGDHLGVLAWNSQAQMECWYGAMGVGIVCHTLNPRLSPTHLAAMIRQVANRVLAISPDLTSLAEQLIPLCPTIEHVVVLDEPGAEVSLPNCDSVRAWRYDDLLEERGRAVAWGGFDENAPAGLCFTSGTTGAPKGVTYTHRSNYLHTVHQLQADASGLTARDSVLVAVPMFHANGWGFPFAGPAVGAKLVLPGRHHDGPSLANLINAEGVTVAAGVATVWLGLADHLDRTGGEVPSLQRIMLGGAAVPQALMDRLEQRFDVSVQTSWGMTELSPLGTVTPATAPVRRSSSSGRPPIGVDLLLTDADGVPLPEQRGREGRLRVRGASVIERYFGHDVPAVDANGWFDTGDLASIDGDGNVSITGRAKDLIKSGGEWINPGEIEAIVGALPEVALVAVVGRTDAKWGERPILIIEPRKGAHIPDEALLDALRARVATWWLPDAIVRVAAMPLAMTGKIDKKRLRAEHG